MNKLIILLAVAIPAITWHGTSEDEVRRPIHLNLRTERAVGFAQAYQVGKTVYVSGLTGKGDTVQTQIRNAYKQLNEVLEVVQAEPSHVVKETMYTTNMGGLVGAGELRKAYYGEHLCASSFIGVERLLRQNDMVAIDVVIEMP